jgi:Isocitrate/isopropylmalate dehydrogenase
VVRPYTIGERFEIRFFLQRFAVGAAGAAAAGDPLPDATRAGVTRADAVLLGAVGDLALEQAPMHLQPESGLLALRRERIAEATRNVEVGRRNETPSVGSRFRVPPSALERSEHARPT